MQCTWFVVSGSGRRTLEDKIMYHSGRYSRPSILASVVASTDEPVEAVAVIPAILTWRGVWAKISVGHLKPPFPRHLYHLGRILTTMKFKLSSAPVKNRTEVK